MIKKYSIYFLILIILFFTIFGLINLPNILNKKEKNEDIELIPTPDNQIKIPINTPTPIIIPTTSILAPTLNYRELPDPTDL